MKDGKFYIECRDDFFDGKFEFEYKEDSAWYDYDHVSSLPREDGMVLTIDANCEVYAVLTEDDERRDEAAATGTECEGEYGLVGDEENEELADNYPVDEGETYYFSHIENPYKVPRL